MAKDAHDDKSKPNIKAVRNFRLKGELVNVGDVVAKKSFAQKADWQNLVHMDGPRAEETDEKVGKAKSAAKGKTTKAADKKEGEGGLPGA